MSHITPLKTSFTRLDCLSAACEKLGLALEQGQGLSVRDYYGKSVPVEARVALGGKYDLGFRRTASGELEMVADFWGIARDCAVQNVRDAIRQHGSAERALPALLDYPYNLAVAEATIAEQYGDCEVQYTYDAEGALENIVLIRRRY